MQLALVESRRNQRACHLSRCVDPRIGSASRSYRPDTSAQLLEGVRELALHRALVALLLPAVEIAAIVVQDELDSPVVTVVL